MGPPTKVVESRLSQDVEDWLEYLAKVRQYSPQTVRAYRCDVWQLLKYLWNLGIEPNFAHLEPKALHQWAAHLAQSYRPATVRRKLDTVSSLVRHLCNLGLAEANPLATIPRPRRKRQIPEPPSAAECQKLLAACPTSRERAVMALLVLCGLRKSELIGLDCSDLASDLRQLRVRHAKGGDERVIPLCETARSTVRYHMVQMADVSGALILNRSGKRIGQTSLQRLFKRIVKRAGLSARGFTIHSCRHAFASELLRAGANLRSVQLLLGHRSITSTEQYLHVTGDDQNDAVARLDEVFSPLEDIPSDADPTVYHTTLMEVKCGR